MTWEIQLDSGELVRVPNNGCIEHLVDNEGSESLFALYEKTDNQLVFMAPISQIRYVRRYER